MTLNSDRTGRRPGRRGVVAVLSLAFAALILVVGAIAGNADDADRPAGEAASALDFPATAPAPPPPAAPSIGDLPLDEEAVYIQVLDDEGIYYSSEDAAIKAGWAVCDFLEAGGSFLDAADIAMSDGGYSPYDAGYIVGAAEGALCPGSGR
jgi:hypothetical protein